MTSPRSRRALRRWLGAAIAVAAVVVVVLLVLVAEGVLTIPAAHAPTPVTIQRVQFVIQQGVTSDVPWFGPSPINFTTGYPLQVAPGAVWSVVWENFFNFDRYNHTINRVTPSAPFGVSSTLPALPDVVPFDSEGNHFAVYLQAPSTPGSTYVVTVTVSALTEG